MKNALMPHLLLLAALAGWLNKEQQKVLEYLREEHRVLRAQLGDRSLGLDDDQRRRLAKRGNRPPRWVAGLGQVRPMVGRELPEVDAGANTYCTGKPDIVSQATWTRARRTRLAKVPQRPRLSVEDPLFGALHDAYDRWVLDLPFRRDGIEQFSDTLELT